MANFLKTPFPDGFRRQTWPDAPATEPGTRTDEHAKAPPLPCQGPLAGLAGMQADERQSRSDSTTFAPVTAKAVDGCSPAKTPEEQLASDIASFRQDLQLTTFFLSRAGDTYDGKTKKATQLTKLINSAGRCLEGNWDQMLTEDQLNELLRGVLNATNVRPQDPEKQHMVLSAAARFGLKLPPGHPGRGQVLKAVEAAWPDAMLAAAAARQRT